MDAMARTMLQLGCFLIVGAALMLLVTESGTAEHVISYVALAAGLVVAAAAIIALRIGRGRKSPQEDE